MTASHPRLRKQILPRIHRRNLFQFFHQVAAPAHPSAPARSPGSPRTDRRAPRSFRAGTPFSFSRNVLPLFVPGGIRTSDLPSIVGTSIFRAQRSLRHRHRHLGVQIISAPFEIRVRPYHHAQVQISRRRAHRARISFPRHAHSPAIRHACRDAHINRFCSPHASFAAARPACGAQLARAAAAVARHVEPHLPRRLLDRSCSIARRAGLRSSHRARSVARFTRIHPRDLQFLHRAAHRIPEINLDLVFQVAARFVLRLRCRGAAPPAKELAEQIPEARAAAFAAARQNRIRQNQNSRFPPPLRSAAITRRRRIVAIESVLVVHLALLRVRQHVVRFLQVA